MTIGDVEWWFELRSNEPTHATKPHEWGTRPSCSFSQAIPYERKLLRFSIPEIFIPIVGDLYSVQFFLVQFLSKFFAIVFRSA
jgi:hypothetical protein